MVKVDELGDAREILVGASCQDRILAIPYGPSVNGSDPSSQHQSGNAQHFLVGQPATEADEGIEKALVGKIGEIAIGGQIEGQQLFNVVQMIVTIGQPAGTELLDLTSQILT